MTGSRSIFTLEFRLEAAQLVVDQGYTVKAAAAAMSVSKSTTDKWVRQLKNERNGVTNNATALTPDQRKIRELEKRIKRIEMEKEILKNTTVDSIDQCNTYVKTLGNGESLNEAYNYSTRKRIYFRHMEDCNPPIISIS